MIGADLLLKAALQFIETINPSLRYFERAVADYLESDNRDWRLETTIAITTLVTVIVFIIKLRPRNTTEEPDYETNNILKFCQQCADEGLYSKDEYLNSSFMHPFNESFPPIYLNLTEKLHARHGKAHEPLNIQYEYSREQRRWVCRKCNEVDRKEDRIAQHCKTCRKSLPREYYPERGWWPQYTIPECQGHGE